MANINIVFRLAVLARPNVTKIIAARPRPRQILDEAYGHRKLRLEAAWPLAKRTVGISSALVVEHSWFPAGLIVMRAFLMEASAVC